MFLQELWVYPVLSIEKGHEPLEALKYYCILQMGIAFGEYF